MREEDNLYSWEKKLNNFQKVEKQLNKESLVQFHTFVESPNYLGKPHRTKFMYDEVYKLIGEDPYSIFDKKRIVKEYVGLWGKGCKCGDSLLLDLKNGEIKTIKEFTEDRKEINVLSFSSKWKGPHGNQKLICNLNKKKTSIPWKVKKDKIYKVILADGSELKVNETHKFLKRKWGYNYRFGAEWVELKDLKEGDYIVTSTYEYETGVESDLDDMWFLGIMIGDGMISSRDGSVGFISGDETIIEKMKNVVDNKKAVLREIEKRDNCSTFRINSVLPKNNYFRRLLISYGLFGHNCYNKFIPRKIFTFSKKSRIEFLRGLIESDGWIYHQNAGGNKVTEIGYATVSKELAFDLKRLYSSLGIKSRLRIKPINSSNFNSRYGICYEVRVRRSYEGKKLLKYLGWEDKGIWSTKKIRREDPPNIFFESIKSIEYDGIDDVYDLEVKETHNYVDASGVLNHNSGKSTLGFYLELYVIYTLLENDRILDPHELFGIPNDDKLSLVNAATTGPQAKEEYFSRMTECLKHSMYFMDNYDVYESNSSQNSLSQSDGRIDIQTTRIDFPYLLTSYSVNAKNESFEGKNVIFFVMDESSGFISDKGRHNADKIYDTLTTSSREWHYVGLIFSFPRLDSKHDWTYLKLKESEISDSVIGTQKKTWEIKPEKFYSGERFSFTFTTYDEKGQRVEKTSMVPVEYKDRFIKYPSDSVARYMAIPSAIAGRFLQGIDFSLAPSNNRPIFEVVTKFHTINNKEYINKEITNKNYTINGSSVVVIDQAESNCKCVVMIGHRETIFSEEMTEGEPRKIICVDGIYLYDTDVEKGLIVDNDNLAMFLDDMVRQLGSVSVVRMDHWNAVRIKQQFEKQFITVSVKGPRKECYDKTKSLILYGDFQLPNQPDMVRELESQLRALNSTTGTNTKPLVIYGYQDIVDCFVQLVDELWVDDMLDQSNLGVGTILSNRMMNLSGPEARQHLEKERIDRMGSFQKTVRGKNVSGPGVGSKNFAVGSVLNYGRRSKGSVPGVAGGVTPIALERRVKDLSK